MTSVRRSKRSIVASFELKGHAAHREYIFETQEALEEFCGVIKENKRLLEARFDRLMKS